MDLICCYEFLFEIFLIFFFTPPAAAVAKYVLWSVCVCVCVCVCVREDILGTTRTMFVPVAYGCGSVLLRQGDEIPRGRDNFGGFFPHWQCIVQHSIWDTYKNCLTDRDAVWACENYSGPSANIQKLINSCWKVCNGTSGYVKHGITKDAFIALQVLWLLCLFISMSLREDISETTRKIFYQIMVHVAYCHGSIFFRQRGEVCYLRVPCWRFGINEALELWKTAVAISG